MKRILKLFALAGLMALFATSCYKGDIDNLQKQIDQLKTGEIATISSQISAINTSINDLKAVDATLKGLIGNLQQDSQKYASQIAELKAMDIQILAKIAELEAYTSSELAGIKDWAQATFATLKQYDELCQIIAVVTSKVKAVSSDVDDIKKEVAHGYQKAIEEATKTLEESMKKWVNEKFTDYYTIAQIDATLDSLAGAHESADAILLQKINEQKDALAQAKTDLTAAYTTAISTAITTLQGQLNTKIETDIATASQALQAQINSINTEISDIKARLDAAEANIEKLINQIQSVSIVPEYSDGSIRVTGNVDTLLFDVKPASVAQSLVTAYQSMTPDQKATTLSLKLVEVATKSASPVIDFKQVAIRDGKLAIAAKFSDLPAHTMASLKLSWGISEYSTEYFGLYVKPEPEDVFVDGAVMTATFNNGLDYVFTYEYSKPINNFICKKIIVGTTDVTDVYKDSFNTTVDDKTFTFFFAGDGRLIYDAENKTFIRQGNTPEMTSFKINNIEIKNQLTEDHIELEPVNAFDDFSTTYFKFQNDKECDFKYDKQSATFTLNSDSSSAEIISVVKGDGNTFTINYSTDGGTTITGTLFLNADNGKYKLTGNMPDVVGFYVDGEDLTAKITNKEKVSGTGINDMDNANGNW